MICIMSESAGSYLAISNNMPFSSPRTARALKTRTLVRVALGDNPLHGNLLVMATRIIRKDEIIPVAT